MANRQRGEVEIGLGDQQYTLAFGLGVCAEIEDTCGVQSFEDALKFDGRPSGRQMRDLLRAIVKGNGYALDEAAERAIARTTLEAFMALFTALMERANMKAAEAAAPAEGERPLAGRKGGRSG